MNRLAVLLFPTLVAAVATLVAAAPAQAAIFTVTNTNTSGAGSLDKAILDANITKAADEIRFEIVSLGTVTIQGPFPAITGPLVIDGYTQGNAVPNTAASGSNAVVRVQLGGSHVGAGEALLQINADDTTIKGLSIIGLSGGRIGIGIGATAEAATIEGCFVGLAANGATDDSSGIGIRNLGVATTIGGSTLASRNVISGNDGGGIDERGSATVISNNVIGPSANLVNTEPNGFGISVSGEDASGILIGGSANVIAGNDGDGITVFDTVGGNVEITRNSFRDNGGQAIDLIGDGPTPNDDTDSDVGPNHLQNFPTLTFAVVNGFNVTVEGYLAAPASSYRLEFYLAEPDPSGFGEGFDLLLELTAPSDGGTLHFRYTFEMDQAIPEEFYLTATATNLDTDETSEFSNTLQVRSGGSVPLVVTTPADSGVGSLRAAILAANLAPGPDTIVFALPEPTQTIVLLTSLAVTGPVVVNGYSQVGSTTNTSKTGSNAVLQVEVNGDSIPSGGTFVVDTDGFVVRGLVINGKGIGIQYGTGSDGLIEGNFIGTNRAGTAADGNKSHGIFTGSETNIVQIGGDQPSARNIVSGNSTHGMRLTGDNMLVRGNIVGADKTGLVAIPNGSNGVSIEGAGAEIGADITNDSRQNLIAFNTNNGIAISTVATGATIRGNSIHSNGALGIDLAGGDPGVTPNDADDQDETQNFPVITEVTTTGGETTVEGTLDVPTEPDTGTYTIRVYSNEECDASGHGEGKVFRGAVDVELSDDDESFSVTVPKGLSGDHTVSATATSVASGETSEFSECAGLDTATPLCGDPSGDDEISASDALTVLRVAVGTAVCQFCICDVNASASVTTTDALFVLREAVGQQVSLNCPPCIIVPPI